MCMTVTQYSFFHFFIHKNALTQPININFLHLNIRVSLLFLFTQSNPLRAMFTTATEGVPTPFDKPSHWSTALKQFVAACLVTIIHTRTLTKNQQEHTHTHTHTHTPCSSHVWYPSLIHSFLLRTQAHK